MADKPIIFSAPMVKALVEGRKTMTRRMLNPQPPEGARYSGIHFASDEPDSHFFNSPRGPFKVRQRIAEGDRLYVREAWRTFASMDDAKPRDIWHHGCGRGAGIMYEADKFGLAITKDGERFEGPRDDQNAFGKLRSPMFMPRWASRITLIVTDVRVQRLNDISAEDAREEGVERRSRSVRQINLFGASNEQREVIYLQACRWEFETLWDSINGNKPGRAWKDNPWVAAITFNPIIANINALER